MTTGNHRVINGIPGDPKVAAGPAEQGHYAAHTFGLGGAPVQRGPEGDPTAPGAGPTLTLTEASEASGVNRRAIRRYLDDGRFPGAYRVDGPKGAMSGPWLIPVGDLVAAGVLNPPDAHEPVACVPAATATQVIPLAAEAPAVEHLGQQLAEWRRRAENAEARAGELERTVENLRGALSKAELALEAGQPPVAPRVVVPSYLTETLGEPPRPVRGRALQARVPDPFRRRWWRRA